MSVMYSNLIAHQSLYDLEKHTFHGVNEVDQIIAVERYNSETPGYIMFSRKRSTLTTYIQGGSNFLQINYQLTLQNINLPRSSGSGKWFSCPYFCHVDFKKENFTCNGGQGYEV